MLRANIELAERTDESADDMTAAETAPRPMKVTHGGHRYCITIGRIIFSSPSGIGLRSAGKSVLLQSVRITYMHVDNTSTKRCFSPFLPSPTIVGGCFLSGPVCSYISTFVCLFVCGQDLDYCKSNLPISLKILLILGLRLSRPVGKID